MGYLDQFAKETLARETAIVTHGAVAWQLPPEVGLTEVRLDGLLRVLDPAPLAALAAPWCTTEQADELVIEIKMVGDHLDLLALDRALLRRLARQIQRREDAAAPFDGEVPLWFVAPHVPAVIRERRPLSLVAPGCYRVGPDWMASLWIAANELPLEDELVPFLIARSGRPLDAFVRWVMGRRPNEWLAHVLEYLPMSTAAQEELYNYTFSKSDDPGLRARRKRIAERLLETMPELREEAVDEGQVQGARAALRGVLDARGIALGADEATRIDACADLSILQRWIKQAVLAPTAAEALR
jgi:hypothetical protein